MTRIDYFNDPDAPKANSVVPSTTAIVSDSEGRIVLVKRKDNDLWALPGGGMELGESIEETAVREVKEETGLDVEVTALIGVYTNPHHVMAYDDGEVRQQFSLLYATKLLGGELRFDHESTDIAWIAPSELGRYPMHPSMRLRVQHFQERRTAPYLG
jgi:ADP-ribose pyrophosphatase YjhB (NUDIX family)